MAATGTAALVNEIKPDYHSAYLIAAQSMLFFDQLTYPRSTTQNRKGASVNFPIVESQQPSTSVLDELADVVPVAMNINEIVATLQEYGNAIQVTRLAASTSYADVYKQAAEINGYNLAESLDYIVRSVIGQGQNVVFQNARTARSSLNGLTTSADRMSAPFLSKLMTFASATNMPKYQDGALCSVMHPNVFYDLQQDPQTVAMSQYSHPELLFNGELAMWNGIRIVQASGQKVFWGAGGSAASSLSTTTAAAINVGDTNLKLTSVTNLSVGNILNIIDTAETGNTWANTNEGFYVQAVGTAGAGGTGVTVMAITAGPGSNGGARYAHSSGATANNNAAAYPTNILGPQSITKGYYEGAGPYGETTITGPFDVLGRFLNFGWWALLAYQRTRERWLLRGETGSSQA
jgi:N4-gp56 family major capsid protein